MKRFALLALTVSLVLGIACSGDDDNGVEPEPGATRVVGFAASAAPSLSDVNDSLWDSAAATTVTSLTHSLSLGGALQPSGGAAMVVSNQVTVKLITYNDSLYLRVTWDDETFDCWRERWVVTDTTGGDYLFHQASALEVNEDQLLVLFAGLPEEAWDAWYWRKLTTAIADLGDGKATGFAEGMRFMNDSLSADSGNLAVAHDNTSQFPQPPYIHRDSSLFDGYILYLSADSAWWTPAPGGWEVGQFVPGKRIDSTMAWLPNTAKRASRWNVWTASEWSEATGQYTVVLGRAMNTGFEDDLALEDSVRVRMGITNNFDFDFDVGNTKQGFTPEFRLVFPQ